MINEIKTALESKKYTVISVTGDFLKVRGYYKDFHIEVIPMYNEPINVRWVRNLNDTNRSLVSVYALDIEDMFKHITEMDAPINLYEYSWMREGLA